MMPALSVISPVYMAEGIIAELVSQLKNSLSPITEDYEIVLVNDASPDNSWDSIVKECKKDKRIKGISLSRNFGQHYAITAGLSYAKGEWVVVMDCDLQDKPEEIPSLYKKAQEGYDIVLARRVNRKDHLFKRVSSKLFHHLYSYLSGMKTDSGIANFGIYHIKVIKQFNMMKELSRSFPSLLSYLGFKTTVINVKHSDSFDGKSSYSLRKLLKLSGDVIMANSNKPLKMTLKLGFTISLISFLLAIYNIVARLTGIITVAGFTTTVFSIWFVGGLILFVLGVVGLYIGKIFDQVKDRQLFIVSEKINIEDGSE